MDNLKLLAGAPVGEGKDRMHIEGEEQGIRNRAVQEGLEAAKAQEATAAPIGKEQVKHFTQVLQKYKAGKVMTERRILASENWWKLRNSTEEQNSEVMQKSGFKSVSGWLHNVIVSKHADAVEAYPEPNILPREDADRGEAKMLSAIIPCIMEQNAFEHTYSEAMWQKLKTGTGVYKVVWDSGKLNGLGDIGIERCNLLNLYWEPGITDIQRSRYFFHTELWDKDVLEERYPEQLTGQLKGGSFMSTKFLYDDPVDTSDKVTVIEVYYRRFQEGRNVLHYCKYVNDIVLYATENEPQMAQRGLYDHGLFPYVFDALYPIEGSPCGYGFVDLCRNPQMELDLLKTSFVKNAMAGSVPRYFSRMDGNINEEEFLDLSKTVVHVTGNVDEASIRRIEHNSLDGNYLGMLDRTIQELRETSGNTETSTGSTSSGVTAASAIAALQEASGKGSRDSTKAAYRAYSKLVELCIELIRQFYDLPRKFRILGQYGTEQYVTYTNRGLQPQSQAAFGTDMGFRLPVFDIKVSAQKKNVYTKVSQNELALQLFKMGFFNPQMTDQALMCLDIMDFEGKDTIMQKVAQNGTLQQKLAQFMQLALALAQKHEPQLVPQLSQSIMQVMGGGGAMAMGGADPKLFQADNVEGLQQKEHAFVEKSRAQSQNASQPDGAGKEDKK